MDCCFLSTFCVAYFNPLLEEGLFTNLAGLCVFGQLFPCYAVLLVSSRHLLLCFALLLICDLGVQSVGQSDVVSCSEVP